MRWMPSMPDDSSSGAVRLRDRAQRRRRNGGAAMRSDREQVGALCVRRADDGSPQVLLITSRGSGRWVIPKGWPVKRLKDHQAAALEAEEEAGVSGKVRSKPIGKFSYPKTNGRRAQSL